MERFIFTLPIVAVLIGCSGRTVPKTTRSDGLSEVQSAMNALRDTPSPKWFYGARPGGAHVLEYNEPMKQLKALGDNAIPILIANLDDDRVRYQCVQILGDLRATEAVPKLVLMLKQEDDRHDILILGALGRITEHPDAYKFYRFYFNEGIRQEASREYTRWWEKHRFALPANKSVNPSGG